MRASETAKVVIEQQKNAECKTGNREEAKFNTTSATWLLSKGKETRSLIQKIGQVAVLMV